MTARSIALALDPVTAFGASGMVPDPWQVDLMTKDGNNAMALCSRQVGKTQAAAGAALHTAEKIPGSLSLMVAPTDRQSTEAFRRVAQMHRAVHGRAVPDTSLTMRTLELPNASRVISVTGGDDANLRVYGGVNLLILDEAARLKDSTISALTPMLATTNGRIIMLSTPFLRSGFFFEQWTYGENWDRYEVDADQCSRISQEFLDAERARLPSMLFRQEYFLAWGASGNAAFEPEQVDAALIDGMATYEPDRTRLM